MAELTTDAQALSSEDWFVADSFSFGVEREMKDSGENGGIYAASADFKAPEAGEVDRAGAGMQDTEKGVTGMFGSPSSDAFDFKALEAPEAPEAPGVAEQLGYGGLQQTFAIEIDMNPVSDDGRDGFATYQPDTVDVDLSLLAVDTGGIPVSMGEYAVMLF